MTKLARIGAAAFGLWGLLHAAGGLMILNGLRAGPEGGFALYRTSAGPYPELAGSILGYLAFAFVAVGLAVLAIAARGNWRNGETALALNSGLVLVTEAGLILFLLIPGHVGLAEALPGFALALLGIVTGGKACRMELSHARG
jgi:hypothetical protein